ncbi:MAG TPA: LCP family protein [Acidimicrobiales bacterium]|nr:LCP family protein [Acidimicrobiales bacterium]
MLIAIAATALIAMATAGGLAYVKYRYDQINQLSLTNLTKGAADKPMNILLVGNNSREVLNGKLTNAFGSAQEVGGARSDVTMILHLDPTHRRASLLSIPRDTFMPIPGTDQATRVDAALNSGPQRLIETIQDDLGIPINHFVELNFDSFQDVVAALGGVNMYFPAEVKDAESALNVTQTGCLQLNGFQALSVVRARHLSYMHNGTWQYDPNGDLSRIQRDHEFLRVLGSSVAHRGLSNPLTLNSLVSSVAPKLQVDSGFSLSTMISLTRQYRSLDPNGVPTATLPVTVLDQSYVYRGSNFGSIVLPAEPADHQAMAQFLSAPAPAARAPDVSVQVQNGSGLTSQGQQVTAGLRTLGYNVTGLGTTPVTAHPSESIIFYAPGHLAKAQRLKADLSGSVIMGQAPTPPGTDVVLLSGSDLKVASPPPPPTAAAPGTIRPAPTQSHSTAPATATPSSAAPTPAQAPLPAYNPTACPPGSKAVPDRWPPG